MSANGGIQANGLVATVYCAGSIFKVQGQICFHAMNGKMPDAGPRITLGLLGGIQMPCEDYPCCGHQSGDCPRVDRHGREWWTCVQCGKRLPKNAPSSICSACMRKAYRRVSRGEDMFPERNS